MKNVTSTLRLATGLTVLAAALAAGCASPVLTTAQSQVKTSEKVAAQAAAFAAQPEERQAVRVVEESTPSFSRKARAVRRGDVAMKTANAPVGPVLAELARKAGFSITFAESIDVNRKVSVEFNQTTSEDAIRIAAYMGGYVAVFDKDRRLVTVVESATMTYKLPSGLLANLKATYKVGNSGSGSSSSSSGSGATAGAIGGPATTVSATFGIEGSEGPSGDAVVKLITDAAGAAAAVTVSPTGYVSVRGNAQVQSRVSRLLKQLSVDALRQVDIEASVVEVELTRDFAYGISWDKVLQKAGGASYKLGVTPADTVTGALSLSRTGASSTAILQALEQFTDVNVVSQPRLVTLNNTPSNFVEAVQVPYLGNIEQTAATVSGGQPTVSGQLSFALDGITFSVVPSVIDSEHVQISLLPVLDTVGEMQSFALGSSKLTAPKSGKKQSFMKVVAENGKTLILGGIRTGTDSTTTRAPATTAGTRGTKEVVILLRANIIESSGAYDPLVAESI